jgi:hypothetical protein
MGWIVKISIPSIAPDDILPIEKLAIAFTAATTSPYTGVAHKAAVNRAGEHSAMRNIGMTTKTTSTVTDKKSAQGGSSYVGISL